MMDDIASATQKRAMMEMAKAKMQGEETRQNVQLCIMVSANREKMTGDSPYATTTSDAAVQQADRIILRFLNGLQEEDK